jgi:hypothetical protein
MTKAARRAGEHRLRCDGCSGRPPRSEALQTAAGTWCASCVAAGRASGAPVRSAALKTAAARLAATERALNPAAREAHAETILGALTRARDARTGPILAILHEVVGGGATTERVDRLVGILQVLGPEVRDAVVRMARSADKSDPFESRVWEAIADVAAATCPP